MYVEWVLNSSFVTELPVNCLRNFREGFGCFLTQPVLIELQVQSTPNNRICAEVFYVWAFWGNYLRRASGRLFNMTYQHNISRILDRRKRVVTSACRVHLCFIYAFKMRDYKRSYIPDLLSYRLIILGASCQEILPISLSVLQLLQSTLLTMKPGPWFCLCQTLEQTEECEAGISTRTSWHHNHY